MNESFWGKKKDSRSGVVHWFVDCSERQWFSKSMCGSVIEKPDIIKRIAVVQPTYLERCNRCLTAMEKKESAQ